MTIKLTMDGLKAIFPRAPQQVIDNLLMHQQALDDAGITHTRQRLAFCFANVEYEVGGFSLPGLTENINYTPERAAQIWPSRFKDGNAVRAKYGTAPGWQKKMFDDVYGNRMGNRPGTEDGSKFIGRGGPQITGRDGYREVGTRSRIPLEIEPQLAARYENQAQIIAGFIDWKKINTKADVGDFKGYVKFWNGGNIGMADREERMRGNDPIIARLENVDSIREAANDLPGAPPTPAPPKEVLNEATKTERRTQAGAGAGTVASVGHEGAKATMFPKVAVYSAIGICAVIVIVTAVLIVRKKRAVVANWN